MNKSAGIVCAILFLVVSVGCPLVTRAQAPVIPVPERAKVFLDPVETLFNSAPPSAVQKLRDDPSAPDAAAEINRYLREYAVNKSVVLHTTVEAAQPRPDVRNAFRIRAASVPLQWDGGTMQRLCWLYFQEAHAAAANSVKVGSEITVVGWVRKCEVVKTEDGLRLNFDLQGSKIENASMPVELTKNAVADAIETPTSPRVVEIRLSTDPQKGLKGWRDKEVRVSTSHVTPFKIVGGLKEGGFVSLEAVGSPGAYLRHFNFVCYVHQRPGTTDLEFQAGASFKMIRLEDDRIRFEASTWPDYFLAVREDGSVIISRDSTLAESSFVLKSGTQ